VNFVRVHDSGCIFDSRGGDRGRLAGAGAPARNFFSSPSLDNINIFSLNNKTTNILAPFNSFFWFRPCLTGYRAKPGSMLLF